MSATPHFPFPRPILDPAAAQALFATLQQQATALGLTLRAPPSEPTTCCGRGCNGCVWEGFYAATAYWQEEALTAIAAAPACHPRGTLP